MERFSAAAESAEASAILPRLVVPATGPSRYRVDVVLGCVQRLFRSGGDQRGGARPQRQTALKW